MARSRKVHRAGRMGRMGRMGAHADGATILAMILANRILGHCDDAFWSAICEEMERRGAMELLLLEPQQLKQRHFRATTDRGTVVGVNLSEESQVRPGSIVFYEEDRRIVLARLKDARVLVIATLSEFSIEDALTLGHYLGGVGWPIQMRHHSTHVEIFVDCALDESEMENVMRACPLLNIAWTFRDRTATDPTPTMNAER